MAVSACSSIPIKDVTLYWPIGPDGAVISHTESDETGLVDKPQWEELSRSMVCQSYDDFAWIRGTIEKLCSEHKGLCSKQTQERVASLKRRTRLAARQTARELEE